MWVGDDNNQETRSSGGGGLRDLKTVCKPETIFLAITSGLVTPELV
jgi:hypothetical protein